MPFKFFTIPVMDPQAAEASLNAFVGTHRVITVERQFVADGANSLWSVCVSYVNAESRPSADRRQGRIDYRELLPPPEFAVFAKLRALRKAQADRDGVPLFAIFTNEHLADMVRHRVMSLEGLGALDGVGKARLEKYGKAFTQLLKQEIPALSTDFLQDTDAHETHAD
jgi:superfamily II DNA helicase RecQ